MQTIPIRSLRPTNYSAAFEKMKQQQHLDEDEVRFYESIRTVQCTGIYEKEVLQLFANFSVLRFREFVCELLSQSDAAPVATLKMLGQPSYNLLLALKPKK